MVKTTDCGSVMRGFESHYPPIKKQMTSCYLLFYSLMRVRSHKRVRATCEQSAEDFSLEETKFLKRKSEDTFNANRSRQSHLAPHYNIL